MPVSDVETVAAKFIFAAWIAPLTTLLGIVLAQCLTVGLMANFVGERVWSQSALPDVWARLAFGYVSYGIVMAPLFGWIMLISAWSKRSPMLFIVVLPVVLVVLEGIFLRRNEAADFLSWLISMPTLPRAGLTGNFPDYALRVTQFADQIAVFATPQFVVGTVLAVVLGVASVAARKRYSEI